MLLLPALLLALQALVLVLVLGALLLGLAALLGTLQPVFTLPIRVLEAVLLVL